MAAGIELVVCYAQRSCGISSFGVSMQIPVPAVQQTFGILSARRVSKTR